MEPRDQFLSDINERAEKDNLFPNTYELRRRAFRLISYGCYSKKDLIFLLGRKYRTYNNVLSLCATVLPEHRYQSIRYKHHQRPAFRGDSYDGNENFLAETYRLKSLTVREIFFYIHLLRILGGLPKKEGTYTSARDLDIPLLESSSVYAKSTLADGLDERAISTYLHQLVACGLVKKISGKRPAQYALADDPFANLSMKEAEALLFAVDYFKNTAFLSAPGYFLADTLCHRFHMTANRPQPFHFSNMDIRRILDDDVVYQILCAIESGQSLHVRWHHKPRNSNTYTDTWIDLYPLAIVEEEQGDGRRQLLALFPDAHKTKPTLHKLRIEEIHDLQVYPMESSLSMPCTSAETSTEIHLRIHWNTMEEKQVLVSRLREELPAISILEETNNMMHCSFSCSDQKKYLPVLRTFLPYVELLPKPKAYLFKKMQCDIIETLALYENQPLYENVTACATQESVDTTAPAAKEGRHKRHRAEQPTMFKEVYSGVFRWLVTTYNNLCHVKAPPTMQELLDNAPYEATMHRDLFACYLMSAFNFTTKKVIAQGSHPKPRDFITELPEDPLPILPTTLELRWLKTVLHSSETDVLLDAPLKEKLLASLSHIEAFDLSVWRRQRNRKDIKERLAIHEPLRNILRALRAQQGIVLHGMVYIPLRLCQNVSTGTYHLLCGNLDDKSICHISEDQFPLLDANASSLSEEDTTSAEELLALYLSPCRKTLDGLSASSVTITFHDRFNARERVYTKFSAFDKTSFVKQDGNYHLTVFYRPFEEEDVLRRILSFGAYVTVLEPTAIRDEIASRLHKAQELYGTDAHTDQ